MPEVNDRNQESHSKPRVGAFRRALQILTLIAGVTMLLALAVLPVPHLTQALFSPHPFAEAMMELMGFSFKDITRNLVLIFCVPAALSFVIPAVILITSSIGMFARKAWGYRLTRVGCVIAGLAIVVQLVRTNDLVVDMGYYFSNMPLVPVTMGFPLGVVFLDLVFLRAQSRPARARPGKIAVAGLLVLQLFLLFGWFRVAGYVVLSQSSTDNLDAPLAEPVTYDMTWDDEDLESYYISGYVIRAPRGCFEPVGVFYYGMTLRECGKEDGIAFAVHLVDESTRLISGGRIGEQRITAKKFGEINITQGEYDRFQNDRKAFSSTPGDFSLFMTHNDLFRLMVFLKFKSLIVSCIDPFDGEYREFRTHILKGIHGSLGKGDSHTIAIVNDSNGNLLWLGFEHGDESEENTRTMLSLIAALDVNENREQGAQHNYARYKKYLEEAGDDKEKIQKALDWLTLALTCDRHKEWDFERIELMLRSDYSGYAAKDTWRDLRNEYPDDERLEMLEQQIDEMIERQRAERQAKQKEKRRERTEEEAPENAEEQGDN